MPKYDNDPF